jgi:cytochrome P450
MQTSQREKHHVTAKQPPGPRGHFLLGHLPQFLTRPLALLEECTRTYGDVTRLRAAGMNICVLNHPDLIEEVLVTNSRNFMKPRMSTSAVFGNGLLSSEGEFWRRQRRMMQPAFHRDRLAAYGRITTQFTGRTIAEWSNGEIRDTLEDMSRLTVRIVTRALFGTQLRQSEVEDIGRVCTLALRRSIVRLGLLPFLGRLPLPGNIRFRREVERLDAIMYRMIDMRRKDESHGDDLLAVLLAATDEEGRMTDRQLRDEATTILMAGHETTATALTWIWYLLSQHPEVELKLAAELHEVLAGREPMPDDLPNLKYCVHVVKESMRIYPTGWTMGRTAMTDCTIGGYAIATDTLLLMSQWTVHRDARWFDRPLEFDPDRWNDGLENRIPRFAYFPFGGGPHRCIGDSLTMMEATLILATIAQRVRLRLVPGHPVEFLPLLTLRPKYGMRMTVETR